MSNKHTPELWFHHGPSGSQHCIGGYINASEERSAAAIAHICGSGFSEDEYRANARRIVACVNACRGLPTDELEQKGLVAAVGTELLERDALAAQMLEALEMVIADKAPGYHDCIDDGEAECAWCIARKAIAAARGAL